MDITSVLLGRDVMAPEGLTVAIRFLLVLWTYMVNGFFVYDGDF